MLGNIKISDTNTTMLRNKLEDIQNCNPCLMANTCLLLAIIAWYTETSSCLLKDTEEATEEKCMARSVGAIPLFGGMKTGTS